MAMKLQFGEADLMNVMFPAFEENSAIGKIALQGGGGRDDRGLALILASADVARILPADQITEEPVALWGRLWLAVARIPDPAFTANDKKKRKSEVVGEIRTRQSELPRRVKKRKTAAPGPLLEMVQSVENKDEGEGSREMALVSIGSEENVKVEDIDMQESDMPEAKTSISVLPETMVRLSEGQVIIKAEAEP